MLYTQVTLNDLQQWKQDNNIARLVNRGWDKELQSWVLVAIPGDVMQCSQDCKDCPRPECLREHEVRE